MAEIQARFIRVRADAHLVAAAGDFKNPRSFFIRRIVGVQSTEQSV